MVDIIGLIPARAGSVRIRDKNIKPLAGKPLLIWSIISAVKSGIFNKIIVSSDSQYYLDLVSRSNPLVCLFLRSPDYATGHSPDIEWVREVLEAYEVNGDYAILRPTSPFRSAEMIQKAHVSWLKFRDRADSLRAVQPVSRHPGKMWVRRGDYVFPIMPWEVDGQPWHSNQQPKLPKVYEQNASLEISKSEIALKPSGTISGELVIPYFTDGFEGFDLNTMEDWLFAEMLVEKGIAKLPEE